MNKQLTTAVFVIFMAGVLVGKLSPSVLPFVQAGDSKQQALDLLARNNPEDLEAIIEVYQGCKKDTFYSI